MGDFIKIREEYKIIWSGKTTEKRNGAAIIVSPTHAEMVTEYECISRSEENEILNERERNEHTADICTTSNRM
jgi:hypothetical protein